MIDSGVREEACCLTYWNIFSIIIIATNGAATKRQLTMKRIIRRCNRMELNYLQLFTFFILDFKHVRIDIYNVYYILFDAQFNKLSLTVYFGKI